MHHSRHLSTTTHSFHLLEDWSALDCRRQDQGTSDSINIGHGISRRHMEAVLQNWSFVWQGRILSCLVTLGELPIGIRCCCQVDVFQSFLVSTQFMNHEFSKFTLPLRPPIKETRPTGDLLDDCSECKILKYKVCTFPI